MLTIYTIPSVGLALHFKLQLSFERLGPDCKDFQEKHLFYLFIYFILEIPYFANSSSF